MSETILVADKTIYSSLLTDILKKRNYNTILIEHAEQLVNPKNLCPSAQLIILDTGLLGAHPGNLLNQLKNIYNCQLILTTEGEIDPFLDLMISHNVAVVLNKPFKGSELVNVAEKLIHPSRDYWFGVENHMKNITSSRRIELTRSNQVRPAIAAALKASEEWDFNFELKFEMDLVWQELLTNAIYHSHGYSDYKKQRVAIALPEGYKVTFRYCASETQFGISIRDYQGTLTPAIIINSLKTAVEQQNILEKSIETGEDVSSLILDRGRGLDLVRKMTGEFYFIIDPDHSTEVIIIYDGLYEKDDPFSSIRIFQLPES